MGTSLSSVSQAAEKQLSAEKNKIIDSMEKYVTNSLKGNDDVIEDDDDDNVPEDLEDVRYHMYPDIDVKKYVFPFENLVFEGGGVKGLAYVGAVRLLEEIGTMKQITRFAGTSIGAMAAALLAVGHTGDEIGKFLEQDLQELMIDHRWGYLSFVPNLLSGFGWNPGNKVFQWFGDIVKKKTGDPDITFKQVYEKYGYELCIIATNINLMAPEYFHPKTTPNVPVRVAVRMSMAIPGMFQAVRLMIRGLETTYVDGGVLCNYPIHAYDGWWLSMKNEDCFMRKLRKIQDLPKLFEKKERFGTYNEKTLGFLLFSNKEMDTFREQLERRVGAVLPPYPNTKLAMQNPMPQKQQKKVIIEHAKTDLAVNALLDSHSARTLYKLLQYLRHCMVESDTGHTDNIDKDKKLDKNELKNALSDREGFSQEYFERLFGKDVTVEQAMAAMDTDGDGNVIFLELCGFIEHTGISLQSYFLSYQRTEVPNLMSFIQTFMSSLTRNVKRIFVENSDIKRTCGINTGHVGTADFKLEQADKDYCIRQGYRNMDSFLRHYVYNSKPPLKEEFKDGDGV